MESTTKRYYGSQLLITEETRARLVDPARFAIRRMERVAVVNRRRPVMIHEVYDDDPEPLRAAKAAAQPAFDEAFALLRRRRHRAGACRLRALPRRCSRTTPSRHCTWRTATRSAHDDRSAPVASLLQK